MPRQRGPAYRVEGVSHITRHTWGAVERDLDGALLPYLVALWKCDGDGAVATLAPLSDELRGNVLDVVASRPELFPSPVVKACLCSVPKPRLGTILGPARAVALYRRYVINESSNV